MIKKFLILVVLFAVSRSYADTKCSAFSSDRGSKDVDCATFANEQARANCNLEKAKANKEAPAVPVTQ